VLQSGPTSRQFGASCPPTTTMATSLDVGRFVLKSPGIFYGVAALPIAAAAFSPVPSPLPLIALVGMLRLACHQVIHRRGSLSRLIIIAFSVALGASAQHIASALTATSSGFTSLLSLFMLSVISTIIAFAPLSAEAYFGTRLGGPYTHALLFPALWATIWAGASMSPVGRLFSWSPVVHDLGSYQWLAPYVGPWGADWVIGAGAVIFSDVAGRMIIGAMPDSEEELVEEATAARRPDVPNLITFEEDGIPSGPNEGPDRVGPPPARVRSSSSSRHPLWMISLILTAAALPAYFIDTAPLSVTSQDNLAITVGCVLPGPVTGGHPPQFDQFVNASKTLSAKILIWPEGAVQFVSAADRQAKINRIQQEVLGQKQTGFVGVGFEESVPLDGSSGRYKTRNGFLLLSYTEVVHEYYKRNLVPSTYPLPFTDRCIPSCPFSCRVFQDDRLRQTSHHRNDPISISSEWKGQEEVLGVRGPCDHIKHLHGLCIHFALCRTRGTSIAHSRSGPDLASRRGHSHVGTCTGTHGRTRCTCTALVRWRRRRVFRRCGREHRCSWPAHARRARLLGDRGGNPAPSARSLAHGLRPCGQLGHARVCLGACRGRHSARWRE
jgi:hypothetical protein